MKQGIVLLWGAAWGLPVLAAESPVQPLSTGNVLSMLFGLVLVLALLLGGAWLVRRLQSVQARQGTDGHQIKVLAAQSLGLKDRVLLLRIGAEYILVGSSQQGLTRLHSWHGESPLGDFSSALAQARRGTPAGQP